MVGKDWNISCIPFQKKQKTLPTVLNQKEIQDFFRVLNDPKHLAIAATLYSAGLRLGECLNLKIKDIDSTNMIIIVRDGKGHIE